MSQRSRAAAQRRYTGVHLLARGRVQRSPRCRRRRILCRVAYEDWRGTLLTLVRMLVCMLLLRMLLMLLLRVLLLLHRRGRSLTREWMMRVRGRKMESRRLLQQEMWARLLGHHHLHRRLDILTRSQVGLGGVQRQW